MKEKNKIISKKGVSTIIATMVILLLTIVAAAVLWLVVKNISDSSDGSSQDCLTLDLEVLSCAYAQAGCYGGYQHNDYVAIAIVKRNQGHGELETAKLLLETNNQIATADIEDYPLTIFDYDPKKDLSGLKEYATADVATTDLTGLAGILDPSNPNPIIYATIAPVAKGGIACEANEKKVLCTDLSLAPAFTAGQCP